MEMKRIMNRNKMDNWEIRK